jgi:hypothetical protein
VDITSHPDLELEINLSDRELDVLVSRFFDCIGQLRAQGCDRFDQADLAHLASPGQLLDLAFHRSSGTRSLSAAGLYAPAPCAMNEHYNAPLVFNSTSWQSWRAIQAVA